MELIRYLRRYKGDPKGSGAHQRLLSEIGTWVGKSLKLSGYEVFYEVRLIENRSEIGRVDIVICSSSEKAVIEAKTTSEKNRPKNRKEINRQLSRDYSFFRDNFHVEPRMIGIYRIHGSSKFHYYEHQKPADKMALL